ncbi:hypothetical protein [Aeromonas caviae]|uniref:hypothetical protein n=1 Tax=Aeromonas caviae TaxID=648 RepID=UPI002B466E12|nr:hypothetical protein [Aeromonas caviae]
MLTLTKQRRKEILALQRDKNLKPTKPSTYEPERIHDNACILRVEAGMQGYPPEIYCELGFDDLANLVLNGLLPDTQQPKPVITEEATPFATAEHEYPMGENEMKLTNRNAAMALHQKLDALGDQAWIDHMNPKFHPDLPLSERIQMFRLHEMKLGYENDHVAANGGDPFKAKAKANLMG